MSQILFLRCSVEDPSVISELGFDPLAAFKAHGDSRVAAAVSAGIDTVDFSDGNMNYTRIKEVYDPYALDWEFDMIMHTGHGQFDTMFGDWDISTNKPTPAISHQFPDSEQWAYQRGVYGFCCLTYSYLLPLLKNSRSAVAIAGYNAAYAWAYDPAQLGSLSDTVFTSFHAGGFKFIESLIAGNTWSQAAVDTLAEFDAQIAYWETGAGSSHEYAAGYAAAILNNKAIFEYEGTFQLTATSPTTGTINVSTNLAGATFTLTGADSYSGSGTSWIQETATAGSYTITFGAVAGYNTPAPQSGTLGAGETLSFTATYTAIATTGTINVSTNLAGATFSLSGAGTYTGSGASWSQASAPAGQYTITYGAVAGYNTPANETKTLVGGSSITFTGTYTAVATYATINVTLNISGTFSLIGPDTFTGSGTSWSTNEASPGSYTIVFGDVLGYTAPSSQTGTVSAGETLSFTATYTAIASIGTISVSTNLADATFSIVGPETLSGSGTSWSDSHVAPGDYTITYGAVAGYTTPASELQTLAAGATVTFTGTYSAIAAVGTISVSTSNASATFTLTGPTTYSGSGTSWSQANAPIGTYTITYGNITGYSTPTSSSQTLTTGATITFTGTYSAVSVYGTITVTTDRDDATFTITGPNSYSSTGRSYTATSVPTGTYTIVFGDLSGYLTPSSQNSILSSGGTINFTGIYQPLSNADPDTYDGIIEEGNAGQFTNMGITVRAVNDSKNYQRMEFSPEEIFPSAMPVVPPIPIDAHVNLFEFRNLYDVNTTNVWPVRQSGSGTGLTVQDARGGIAKFVNGVYDDNYYQYFSINEVSKLYEGKGLWLSTGIRIYDVDEADWFFGLCTKLVGGANVFDNRIDSLGFYGSDGSASINVECNKNATSTQTTGIGTLTDNTFINLDIYAQGTTRVFFYINGQRQAIITNNLPDDEEMCVAFGLRNGKREANQFSIRTIQLYQDI